MTSTREKYGTRTLAVFFPSLVSILLLILFIVCSDTVKNAVGNSLRLSVSSVIPSVFPSALLSSVLAAVGGGELFGELTGKPISRVFGASGNAASAVLLGMLCGFPIGAVTAFELYRNGTISEKELFLSVSVSSVPSPAFVIGAVGGAMLRNKKLGILLYLIIIISDIISAKLFSHKKEKSYIEYETTTQKKDFISAVVSAVPSAVSATLNVTAYIVFFSALCACITDITSFFDVSDTFTATLHGLLEISGGCAEASSLGWFAFPMCAAFLGFSGVAVHFQIISATDGKIPLGKYFLFMLLRSLLCFLLALAVISIPFDIYLQ